MTEDKTLNNLENGTTQFKNGHTTKLSQSPKQQQQQHKEHQKDDVTVEFNNGNKNPLERPSTIGGGVVLPDVVLNKLYQSYSVKQRRAGLIWFLVASILFDIWALIIPQGQCIEAMGVTSLVLCFNIILCIVVRLSSSSQSRLLMNFLKIVPHLIWLLTIIQLVFYLFLKKSISPRDVLGWGILLNFLIYVTLPIPLLYTGVTFGVGTFAIYLCTLTGLATKDPLFYEQIAANTILIIASAAVGLLVYFMGEAKQKRVFHEAKKSLEVKMIIEEQSAEQERLLLSVLPKHVAVKMRQDLGSTSSEPFKKIYMSRHENVSILYADIVGFTAISSTYSAQDLVKMLNELFARFDRLAEKYQQLRIKILGDCYYCISGAPVEKPDHAVLCVHMGLSMVKAIKYVQQKTNSPVDMRVGIHTGAVLAGILGQRQWQFDVYSKDVELANKMESSGKAGRVHISNKTLSFLKGEFEVEPALGERREEALRNAGLKTFFITKVLIPFVAPNNQENGEDIIDDDNEEILEVKEKAISFEQEDELDKYEDFKKRLQHELVARDGHGNLSKDTTLFLKFKSRDLETAYEGHREPYSSLPLVAAVLVQFVDVLYSYLVLPRYCLHFVTTISPLLLVTVLVFISVSESFPRQIHEKFVHISKRFNDTRFLRSFAAITISLAMGFSNLVDMYFFTTVIKSDDFGLPARCGLDNNDTNNYNQSDIGKCTDSPNPEITIYPSYMSNFAVLILIAVSVIAQLTHTTKILLMIIIAGLHCAFNIIVMHDLYRFEDFLSSDPVIPTKINVSAILLVAAIALSLLARHMDREDRVIFKWKTEVAEQKEMATDMSKRNEALVYNVLPVHVAEHFMRNKKRSYDELYSQSYSEVGVMFASMPNFADFYSEESVNNQGLECLRFLNEVISDFDALLELPQFQDIIKIKTIGSTYMGASGINIARKIDPGDSIVERWSHLSVLVEFAFELKKALQGINEQSFNHFVLKMGINHGPITAGVIGARKPHYDIWGNTVNVASRMESTGKAGNIQVTEETCNILKEFGYTFEQRGLVSVKGKGQLMTYYLTGRVIPTKPVVSSLDTKPIEPIEEVTQNEAEADSKTPLLNNINVAPSEFSEKDSLIASNNSVN
ncbi:adenylate cyclase type 3 [Episyrphus balteatus]|uniref:adenylate cyclase type 3 n=1 Tax=Episyrphus balteatus TaxID=286459 RepID=UPI00248585D7|nr:adenylate cyclase type 3 [Episyrphus balteatus]XP_055849198.1 adenylate cyclase type 3 [Episyrphus balteatus]